jgi:hypothetical protein
LKPLSSIDQALSLIAYLNVQGGTDYTENVEYFKVGVIAQALRHHGIPARELHGQWIDETGEHGSSCPTLFAVEVDGQVLGSYGDVGWEAINARLMRLHHLPGTVAKFLEPLPSGAPRNFYPAGSSLTESLGALAHMGLVWLQADRLDDDTMAAQGEARGAARL